jgi:hypothetical protein
MVILYQNKRCSDTHGSAGREEKDKAMDFSFQEIAVDGFFFEADSKSALISDLLANANHHCRSQ